MPLTDLQCKNAKPKAKHYKLMDGNGLYLHVLSTGGKSWRYNYKLKNADGELKNGTLSLGKYPALGLAEARAKQIEASTLVSEGTDPNQRKKLDKKALKVDAAQTFSVLAENWLEKRRQEVVEKTLRNTVNCLQRDILPEIGMVPVKEISPTLILAALNKIHARGAHEVANRARLYISHILKYAIACGYETQDYTTDIKIALPKRQRQHQPALAPDEIKGFLSTLAKNDARLYYQTRKALEMLLLTFVRPAELAAAEWAEIDFQNHRWVIPASRMKMKQDHIVPLATQTLAIIEELRQLNGNRTHIFPNQHDPMKHMARDSLSKAIRQLGYQGKHTAHGFRATARTTIREVLNWDGEIIERQLAHAPSGSLGRAYDRTQFIEQRTKMMQEWADYINTLAA